MTSTDQTASVSAADVSRTTAAAVGDRGDRLLLGAAAFFTVAVLVHGADHARRGADSVGTDVFLAGTSAMALEIAIVVIAGQRHRLAPLVFAGAGYALAAGYLVVHFLPARSWLSDSFTSSAAVSPLSWIAASLEIIAALTVGVVGVVTLRQRGGLPSATRPHAGQVALGAGFRHPVALTMIAGNAVILGISVAQLALR
jgi:hypothetical protein